MCDKKIKVSLFIIFLKKKKNAETKSKKLTNRWGQHQHGQQIPATTWSESPTSPVIIVTFPEFFGTIFMGSISPSQLGYWYSYTYADILWQSGYYLYS